jgi:hypothetical protein
MFPRVSLEVSGTTALALLRFLERNGCGIRIDVNEVADQAILAWLEAQQAAVMRTELGQGYRWKDVFLPDGTLLEVRTHEKVHRAHVDGNEILYEGLSVSPNRFVAACAGAPRNAWREIRVLVPGERYWKPAYMLRREVEHARKVALEMATSAAAAGTTVPAPGRPIHHWFLSEPRERRLVPERRCPRGTVEFDDH